MKSTDQSPQSPPRPTLADVLGKITEPHYIAIILVMIAVFIAFLMGAIKITDVITTLTYLGNSQ